MVSFEPTTRYTFTVSEVAAMLGISRTSAYAAVDRGEIGVIRIGGRLVVSAATVAELLGIPIDRVLDDDHRTPADAAPPPSSDARR